MKEPQKTIIGYKLFKVKKSAQGEIFPLYVFADKPLPFNTWLQAEAGERTERGKVKSKLGELAFRPGWHSGDVPVATHIGDKKDASDTKPSFRSDDHVWAEVEISADIDWQDEANARARTTKSGKRDLRTACLTDKIPENGFYRYKTNPNMYGNWIISGAIKIRRLLTDDEVFAINEAHGVHDLPRRDGKPFDFVAFGLQDYIDGEKEEDSDSPSP